MAEHTRGPWSVSEEWGAERGEPLELCFHSIQDSEGKFVSSTWAGPHEANARLIAAAPELLEALQEIMVDLCAGYEGPTVDKAYAAIAKALGDA